MIKISGIVFFHILYVVEIKHKFVSIIAAEYDIKSIINKINVNYNLKNAVKTVAEPFHIEFFIDFTEVSDIHIKLLFKFKSNAVKNQSVKKFR